MLQIHKETLGYQLGKPYHHYAHSLSNVRYSLIFTLLNFGVNLHDYNDSRSMKRSNNQEVVVVTSHFAKRTYQAKRASYIIQ